MKCSDKAAKCSDKSAKCFDKNAKCSDKDGRGTEAPVSSCRELSKPVQNEVNPP